MAVTEESSACAQPMGRLRVAVAIQSLERLGGKERDALAIGEGLFKRGHQVTIITRTVSVRVPSGIAVRTVGSFGWTNHGLARSFAETIAAMRKTNDFDVLLSFEKHKAADAYYAADVCIANRAVGPRRYLPRYATYAKLELDCFDVNGPYIFFLCKKQASEYDRYYHVDANRSTIVPPIFHHAMPAEFYAQRQAVRRNLNIRPLDALAVSVALYPKTKGLDRTVAALRAVPELRLLAVGLPEKERGRAKSLAAGMGFADRVYLFGERNDVANILSAADITLHPARVENTGVIILESLLAGIPVIATAACGFAEYIARYGAGIVLPEPFDPLVYASAIR
jgi:UDP-glucose:(heptosyl)LPS alpha-1,3-glucosyltransferase